MLENQSFLISCSLWNLGVGKLRPRSFYFIFNCQSTPTNRVRSMQPCRSVYRDIGAGSRINYTFEPPPLLCRAFRKTVQTMRRHGSKKLLVPKKVSQAISSRFVGLLALFANLFCSATLFVPSPPTAHLTHESKGAPEQ